MRENFKLDEKHEYFHTQIYTTRGNKHFYLQVDWWKWSWRLALSMSEPKLVILRLHKKKMKVNILFSYIDGTMKGSYLKWLTRKK